MGAFIAPSLLGGGVLVIGTRINTEFGFGANWPGGAALGTFLMIVVLLVIGTVIQYADLEAMFE
jgi:ABC-type spermidine/putrescine transport system permease subunit I